jgi:ubiquinone/menaquinone biosynthesis C-methylase UbiE
MTIWNGTYREPRYWDYFGNRLVELSGVGTGTRVLDVGTGGGAVLIPTAKMVGPRGRVIGVDVWFPCVRATAAAIQKQGLDHAQAIHMDAECLSFQTGCFDGVLSGFVGWDDVFDFDRGQFISQDRKMAEIFRVLREGGRVGISSWAMQEDNEWMAGLVNRYLSAGEGGRIPPCYSKETAAGLTTILRQAGFSDVRVLTEQEDFVFHDEAEWLEVMRQYGWDRYLDQIKTLPGDRVRRFESDAFETLQRHKQADGIHYTRTVLFALGRK